MQLNSSLSGKQMKEGFLMKWSGSRRVTLRKQNVFRLHRESSKCYFLLIKTLPDSYYKTKSFSASVTHPASWQAQRSGWGHWGHRSWQLGRWRDKLCWGRVRPPCASPASRGPPPSARCCPLIGCRGRKGTFYPRTHGNMSLLPQGGYVFGHWLVGSSNI